MEDQEQWREAVEYALRSLLADIDYDLHKGLECGEEDGLNRYPQTVDLFLDSLNYFLSK